MSALQLAFSSAKTGRNASSIIVLLFYSVAGSVLGAQEPTPPKLKSIEIPATLVLATNPEVAVRFEASDDAAGVNYVEAVFVDPSGTFRRAGSVKLAPARTVASSIRIVFPRFSVGGTWTLSHVFLSDTDGNSALLDEDSLRERGFPTRLQIIATPDSTGPKLLSFALQPAAIDTTLGSANVTLSYTVTDDYSGANYVEVALASPSGIVKRASASFAPRESESGSIQITFPRFAEPGRWILTSVFLSDAAGNTSVLEEGTFPPELHRTLDVTSFQDRTPPRLNSLDFVSQTVDTSSGPMAVDVQLAATDDVSGLGSLQVIFESPSGAVKCRGVAEVSGHPLAIEQVVRVIFPKFSESGIWKLDSVFLADAAGNTQVIGADEIGGFTSGKTLRVVNGK